MNNKGKCVATVVSLAIATGEVSFIAKDESPLALPVYLTQPILDVPEHDPHTESEPLSQENYQTLEVVTTRNRVEFIPLENQQEKKKRAEG
jgi:hypothetical protein